MKRLKKYISALTVIVMVLSVAMVSAGCGQVDLEENLDQVKQETVDYILENNEEMGSEPGIMAVGGDWLMKGLIASGCEISQDVIDVYYDNVRARVKSTEGKIHEKYYSDYARVVLGVTAIGENPKNIEGYDITKPMEKYDELTSQGMTAVAYTLVAANEAGIKLEHEEAYLKYLVKEVNAILDGKSDLQSDYLSMSLVGLSLYTDRKDIKAVTDRGIEKIAEYQQKDGSLGNCESTVEAIVALSQLKVDVFSDKRFIKDDVSLGQSLMIFRHKDGGFVHSLDEEDAEIDPMATERALLALDSMSLFKDGKALYERK